MTLLEAEKGIPCIVKSINTNDEELISFLFSLGCYSHQSVTVISRKKSGCIIAVKDSKYSIDNAMAQIIELE